MSPLELWRDKVDLLSDPNGDGDTSDSRIGLLPEQEAVGGEADLKAPFQGTMWSLSDATA